MIKIVKRPTCSILCFWIGTVQHNLHHKKNLLLPVQMQKVCQSDQHSDPVGLIKHVGCHFYLWSNDWWVWLMEMYHIKVAATIPNHPCWLGEKTNFGWKLTHQSLLQTLVLSCLLWWQTVTCIWYSCYVWKMLMFVNVPEYNYMWFTMV